jgi:hypothetical protein
MRTLELALYAPALYALTQHCSSSSAAGACSGRSSASTAAAVFSAAPWSCHIMSINDRERVLERERETTERVCHATVAAIGSLLTNETGLHSTLSLRLTAGAHRQHQQRAHPAVRQRLPRASLPPHAPPHVSAPCKKTPPPLQETRLHAHQPHRGLAHLAPNAIASIATCSASLASSGV